MLKKQNIVIVLINQQGSNDEDKRVSREFADLASRIKNPEIN